MSQGQLTLEQIERAFLRNDDPVYNRYTFDTRGNEPANKVIDEYVDSIKSTNIIGNKLVLNNGYFYTEDIEIRLDDGTKLIKAERDPGTGELTNAPNAHYFCTHIEPTVASITGKEAAYVIEFIRPIPREFYVTYQVVGGAYVNSFTPAMQTMNNALDEEICFLDIRNRPERYRPHEHSIDISLSNTWQYIINSLENMAMEIEQAHLYSYGMLRKWAVKESRERMKPKALADKRSFNGKLAPIDGHASIERMTKSDLLLMLYNDVNGPTDNIGSDSIYFYTIAPGTIRFKRYQQGPYDTAEIRVLITWSTNVQGYTYSEVVVGVYDVVKNEYRAPYNTSIVTGASRRGDPLNVNYLSPPTVTVSAGTVMPTEPLPKTNTQKVDILSIEVMEPNKVDVSLNKKYQTNYQ